MIGLYFKNKVDGSLYKLLLNTLMDCFSFFMECLCSLIHPDIHLHLISSSINIISRPTNIYDFMIEMLFLKTLILVLAYDFKISLWIVCPSFQYVQLNYFFQIYIYTSDFYPSIQHIYITMDYLSFLMACLSSLLFLIIHLQFIVLSIKIISIHKTIHKIS